MNENDAPKYYSIQNVSKMLSLPSSTLRYWEQQFKQIQPRRDDHLNRFYTAEDIEVFKRIKYIRDELKITRIEAIRNELERGKMNVDVRLLVAEQIEKIRDELIGITNSL